MKIVANIIVSLQMAPVHEATPFFPKAQRYHVTAVLTKGRGPSIPGSSLNLSCYVTSLGFPEDILGYAWYHDNVELQDDEKYHGLNTTSITIQRMTMLTNLKWTMQCALPFVDLVYPTDDWHIQKKRALHHHPMEVKKIIRPKLKGQQALMMTTMPSRKGALRQRPMMVRK